MFDVADRRERGMILRTTLLAGIVAFGLVACGEGEDDAAEDAGEAVEETVEGAGEAAEEAGEAAEDATQ